MNAWQSLKARIGGGPKPAQDAEMTKVSGEVEQAAAEMKRRREELLRLTLEIQKKRAAADD